MIQQIEFDGLRFFTTGNAIWPTKQKEVEYNARGKSPKKAKIQKSPSTPSHKRDRSSNDELKRSLTVTRKRPLVIRVKVSSPTNSPSRSRSDSTSSQSKLSSQSTSSSQHPQSNSSNHLRATPNTTSESKKRARSSSSHKSGPRPIDKSELNKLKKRLRVPGVTETCGICSLSTIRPHFGISDAQTLDRYTQNLLKKTGSILGDLDDKTFAYDCDVVLCNGCKVEYHYKCVGYSRNRGRPPIDWLCFACTEQQHKSDEMLKQWEKQWREERRERRRKGREERMKRRNMIQ